MRGHKNLMIHIPRGERNAVSMCDLASVLGVEQRTLRKMIETARIDGVIIAGTNAGIFVPETKEELKEYVHRTQNRIRTSIATLAPAIECLEGLENE